MTTDDTNNETTARDYFSRGLPRVIEESTDLEAYYPLLSHTDDIYVAAKDRTRARAFKRLAACMIDGISYTVMKTEEIRASTSRDILGVFVVKINYAANIDTLLA